MPPKWLHPLVKFEDFEGIWDVYLSKIYEFYRKDFVDDKPKFKGKAISVKRHPEYDNKEATFWHIISDGKVEDARVPNLRRCERIRWPAPIIQNSDFDKLKIWENKRGSETRILIWFEEMEYLVVLVDKKKFILFLTAYPTDLEHTKRKLGKEYCENKKPEGDQ
jgi:hypothetical protein